MENTQIIDLLNNANCLLALQQQSKQQEVERVLIEAKPYVEKMEKEIKENAMKFNVFSALGVTRKEVIQSRFLAYLLNPKEQHCQDALFLNELLKKIEIPEVNSEIVKVTPEYYVGENGRIDIVIDCQQADWLIVIENKIDAGEGEQQLERYEKWLNEQKYKQQRLIFLTPTGHESVTAIKDSYYIQLSYLELAELFESTIGYIQVDSVKSVLLQYITNLKLIGGVNMTENKELVELLFKPENIKTALEIEQQVLFIRRNIIKDFLKNIKILIDNKIKSENIAWESFSNHWENEKEIGFHVGMKAKKDLCYQIRINNVFSNKNGGNCLHILCPKEVDKTETQRLATKMINDGYQKGWISGTGCNYDVVAQRLSNKQFISTNIDDIIKCQEDNQPDTHPLAKEIVDEIWAVFESYRPDIESLPSFKSPT